MEVRRSGCGTDAWFIPPAEAVTESGDCVELGVADGGGSIGDGIGDGIKAVDNGVRWCDSQDGDAEAVANMLYNKAA
jgi:hypothetical protein